MSKHVLSLDIPVTYNPKILRVVDTSQYAESVPVTCGNLIITPPGYNLPVDIEVVANAHQVLNACLLDIQQLGCEESMVDLPDGIYVIRYEVAPLHKVFVEYNHLRVTQVMNQYFYELSRVCLQQEEPTIDALEDLAELRLIKSYIDAAVVKVEIRHEPEDGLMLLNYANQKLHRFRKKSIC
jgi:hypothetical protein